VSLCAPPPIGPHVVSLSLQRCVSPYPLINDWFPKIWIVSLRIDLLPIRFDRCPALFRMLIAMTLWEIIVSHLSEYRCEVYPLPREAIKNALSHALSEQEIRDAVDSFAQFPALVEELTSGKGWYRISDPYNRERTHFRDSDRTRECFGHLPMILAKRIDRFASAGTYDSIFCPSGHRRDLAADLSIQSGRTGASKLRLLAGRTKQPMRR